MRKVVLLIIVLILSILLVSGCLQQVKETLTNNKQLYDKQVATPTPTPILKTTPTVTPTNISTPIPTPNLSP